MSAADSPPINSGEATSEASGSTVNANLNGSPPRPAQLQVPYQLQSAAYDRFLPQPALSRAQTPVTSTQAHAQSSSTPRQPPPASVPPIPVMVDMSALQIMFKTHMDASEKRLRHAIVNHLVVMQHQVEESHTKVIDATKVVIKAQNKEREAVEKLAALSPLAHNSNAHGTPDAVIQEQLDKLFIEIVDIRENLASLNAYLDVGQYRTTVNNDSNEDDVRAKLTHHFRPDSPNMLLDDDVAASSDRRFFSRGVSADMDADGEPEENIATRKPSSAELWNIRIMQN